ncbi:unnamed protein product, partial [Rotaria sp. Silwood1]
MATSSSSHVKSESTGPFYSDHEANLSYTLEHNLPNQIDSIPPSSSSSIFIDAPVLPSNETPSEFLQGFSAPTPPVYINMSISEQTSDVDFAGPITTTDPPLSPSYTDYPLPSTTVQRYSHYHHLPHHSQNQNRYPYVPYYEQRSAFRRPRTPNAPSMPEHLLPGYTQDRTATSRNKNDRDYNENKKEEDQRPSKSFWVILRLVLFVLVIEFIEAVETALTVPILTSLHVDESYYSMAWLISPILGFFFQPIVGMWSDTCKCQWGRRRPFILAFAIGAYIGIALLLNSSDFGELFGDSTASETIPIRAVVLTAVGVTLIDFCADSANAPIRAYLIDTTNPSDQERGFNIHAILGFGGGLGFIVGTIKWTHISMFKKDGGEFSVICYIATFLFIVCTISTLTSVREEPLIASSSRDDGDTKNSNDDDEQPEIEVDEKRPLLSPRRNSSRSYNSSNKPIHSTANIYFRDLNKQEGFVEIDSAIGERIPHDHVVERPCENILFKTFQSAPPVTAARISNSDPFNPTTIETQEFDAELHRKAKLVKLGFMRRPASQDNNDCDDKDNVTIKSMIISMVRIPARLWKLMVCQVIGWIGYFATHLYFTDFVAIEVYNGTMKHGSDDPGFFRYKLGVTMGCWGLFVFSASGAIYAFCLERWLANRFSLKALYFIGYFIYVLGCTVNFFFHQVTVNIAMCFTFGILVVSLNTLPYQMLSQFHADKTYRNRDGSKRGIGIDCALLNSCHFLGELIVAVSLGPLLAKTGVNYCMVIAAGFTLIGN